MVAPSNLEGTK